MRTARLKKKKKKKSIFSPDSRLFALPGCKPVSYSRVVFHYWAEHQQREAQVMLVSTGKATEGLAGWRANTHYKGKQQEPMSLTPRGEAEELRSGPALLT